MTAAAHRWAANAFLPRLEERAIDRHKPITMAAFRWQLTAIEPWGEHAAQDLAVVGTPVLAANGDHDIMVPGSNSVTMADRLPDAQLVLYPDAGHGGIFQCHEAFWGKAQEFLSATGSLHRQRPRDAAAQVLARGRARDTVCATRTGPLRTVSAAVERPSAPSPLRPRQKRRLTVTRTARPSGS